LRSTIQDWWPATREGKFAVPSEEYCQGLLEDVEEALEDAIDALDDYYEADDEMDSAADESFGGFAKAGVHGVGGDITDAISDWIDGYKASRDFDRAAARADRAREKFESADGKAKSTLQKWCEECGDPPDSPDLTDAETIDFGEDDVDPIIGHPF
jgi:hypothetical protein